MTDIFADTFYWVSLANPDDKWHSTVKAVCAEIGSRSLVTTDEVLSEFLTFYSGFGPSLRRAAAIMVHAIRLDAGVRVLPQSRLSFDSGLRPYEGRLDKKYSLADCISMEAMRAHQLHEVLTNDHHFEQEGFTVLIK